MLGRSPNTVKSYARALALWWEFLAVYELAWDAVTVEDLGRFLGWLRTGDRTGGWRRSSGDRRALARARWRCACRRSARSTATSTSTASRPRHASTSGCSRGRHAYKPMLEHLARRRGHERRVVRVSRPRPATPPTLTPEQVGLILDALRAAGIRPPAIGEGSVRDRLLWALLAESGMRLGEALALQHRDWHTGLGDTPFVEVVAARGSPARAAGQERRLPRIYISDELDRLYGEYLWRLCDAGADVAVGDLDGWWVFVNLAREPRFAPLRAETVAWQVRRLRRVLEGQRAGRRSRRTGCGTRTRRRCCCPGSPSMSSAAASGISTSRRRRTSTGGCPRTPSSAPSRSGSS